MQTHRIALAAVVLLASCHHDEAAVGSVPPAKPSSPDVGAGAIHDREITACKALWTPLCASLATCEPVEFTSQFENQDDCVSAFALGCATGNFGPESGSTPENMTACAQALDVSTCTKLAAYGEGIAPAACLPPGKKANGASCLTLSECRGGVCAQASGSICGACATAVTTPGGTCGDNSGCVHGLFCKSGKCEPAGAKGAACDDKDPCAPLLACVGGKCADLTPAGGACSATEPSCASDSSCNTTSNTCELIQSAKLGATCGFLPGGDAAICEHGARCKAGKTSSDPATCVAAIPLGSTCTGDYLFGSGCVAPGVCLQGQCIIPTPSMCQ